MNIELYRSELDRMNIELYQERRTGSDEHRTVPESVELDRMNIEPYQESVELYQESVEKASGAPEFAAINDSYKQFSINMGTFLEIMASDYANNI